MTQQDGQPGEASGARLRVSTMGAVRELRLNRPEKRNAIDDALREELLAAVEAIARDDEVRAVILTGEGSAFCAGGDVSAMHERLAAPSGRVAGAGWRRIRRVSRLIAALHDLDRVTIAAVNGPAFGFGMDLALCCDFVLASDRAAFAMSYLQRGLIPDGGGLYFLPRRVGLARAKELIFSGRRVDAGEALALGIADRLVPATELPEAALAWAQELAQRPPTALGLAKSILDRSLELELPEVLALGAEATAICYTTEEHRDLVAAFLGSSRSRRA
ncbi:MAG TPA: enoyl-CoA hydratase-related protein [Acidimicrobiales bacterium]|nr:enoyl-CoA hydratase-related protein [Acidimicrobiales bacterium]HLH68704.1 enoyl-CoA hydratase-related protein [Candidatus Dormibacteraeota bacterium]